MLAAARRARDRHASPDDAAPCSSACAAAFWGIFFTFFMLTPMLMAFGPSGETGDVKAIFRFLTGKPPTAEKVRPHPPV